MKDAKQILDKKLARLVCHGEPNFTRKSLKQGRMHILGPSEMGGQDVPCHGTPNICLLIKYRGLLAILIHGFPVVDFLVFGQT